MTATGRQWEDLLEDCAWPPGVRVGWVGPEDTLPHDAASGALLPGERALLSPGVRAERLREFTAGRVAARQALGRLAPELGAVPIARRGERAPQWPPGIVGAISHHRGLAVAAVARRDALRGLGVDVEGGRVLSGAMQRRVFRPGETAHLAALGAEPNAGAVLDPDALALLLFSAKESLFKALHPHTGVFLGFQDARICLHGGQQSGQHGGQQGELPGDAARGALEWELFRDCGPGLPVGFRGPGAWAARGGWLLTACWLDAEG